MTNIIDDFINNEEFSCEEIYIPLTFEMKKYYVELIENWEKSKSSGWKAIKEQNKFLKLIDRLCDIKFSIPLKKLTEIERMLLLENIGCVFDFSLKELKNRLFYDNISLYDLMNQLGCNVGKKGSRLYNDFIYSIYKHSDEFHNFLREHITDMNSKDVSGKTPLMKSITELGPDMTCILLIIGADVNIQDENGDTALHFAALKDAKIVELLLDYDCDATIKNKKGQSAMDIARLVNNLDAVKILEQYI